MTFASLLISFFRSLVLFGALQGIIAAILLLCRRPVKQSNVLLALLLILLAMASFNTMSINEPWLGMTAWLDILANIFPLVVIMPVGPLLYFYIRSYLEPDFRLRRRQAIHFYPVALDLLPYAVAAMIKAGWINGRSGWDFIDNCNVYTDIARWISVSAYVAAAVRYLQRQRPTEIREWPRQLTLLFCYFQAIWLFYLIPYIIPQTRDHLLSYMGWYPVYLPLTVIIYWLSIKGYLLSLKPLPAAPLKPVAAEVTAQAIRALQHAMETARLYLQPDLNLQAVANATGIPAKTISAVLNQHLQMNFNEYVNSYRVEEFKRRVMESDMQQYTIAGLALECGFNSQATFQRSFRQLTGMPPSQFLQMRSCSG
ncbi:helix-turn-helix domain-containing protein [Chitinophaga vietnamensis]|uniref:helix-turn-helix domain-containing protein n=1 Tax=Chitinophaga vietnamensis TaxID=2593957 RepID=UPI001177A20F|nr:helix-turn-helix domain-containing protein [Chitinophaga vietnamensis]